MVYHSEIMSIQLRRQTVEQRSSEFELFSSKYKGTSYDFHFKFTWRVTAAGTFTSNVLAKKINMS